MDLDIIIRPMLEDDFSDGALLMSYAFGEKFPSLSKLSQEEVRDFMLVGGIFYKKSLEGHYVAIKENKIVGILHLDTKKLQKDRVEAPIKPLEIIKKYGLITSLLSGLSILFLHYNVPEGECMVDFIAVHPEHRGCGIGSQLLDYGENVAREISEVKYYTLRVIEKNKGAMRLYERYGFKVISSNSQYIAYLFTRVKKYYKMAKKL